MDEDITRKVIVINDKFQGIDREVSVYSSELLLSPHFLSEGRGFLPNIAYLGVVDDFGVYEGPGRFHGNPFIRLEPFLSSCNA